jgi:Cu(I)/Ag(I) efflux system protein CusF
MNRLALVLAVLMLAGCDAAPDSTPPTATSPPAAAPATTPAPASAPAVETRRGSTTGIVQAVDTEAKTITIAHGPVEALGWPGMTMAFQAPDSDLSTLEPGDEVAFEFDATGSEYRIVSITKR